MNGHADERSSRTKSTSMPLPIEANAMQGTCVKWKKKKFFSKLKWKKKLKIKNWKKKKIEKKKNWKKNSSQSKNISLSGRAVPNSNKRLGRCF